MITAALFRKDLTEFADPGQYPDTDIAFWLNISSQLLNQNRWGTPAAAGQPNTLYDFGQEMFVAHNLVLEKQAKDDAALNNPPGVSNGAVSAMSVDKASINYDVSAGIEEGAGHWNLTKYGTRFVSLMKMIGAGGIQIGVGCLGLGPLSLENAWMGPWAPQVPNPSN